MDIIVFAALLLWFVVSTVSAVSAHEWYPTECCSDTDCAPIALSETPREEGGGYTLIDGRHVRYRDLRASPDGRWHLCENKWPADSVKDRKILCLYAPLGGV